jgi:transposase
LDTSRLWLAKHQLISIVARDRDRDRGRGYGEAIAKALPDAQQIADRWHLMENSSRAFLDAVGKSSGRSDRRWAAISLTRSF